MKKIIAIGLVIVLFVTIASPVGNIMASGRDEYDYNTYADILKVMGLFKGTEKGYETDRYATRIEAAVMLIRLLGIEEKVLSTTYDHPFTDVPGWADRYIGFMYQTGLTQGVGNNRFGSNLNVTPQQYTAFLLRALDYFENQGDFTYDKALDKGIEIGIYQSEEINDINRDYLLSRGEMVYLSYNSLTVQINSSTDRLIDKLNDLGVISEYCVNALGLTKFPEDIIRKGDSYIITSEKQLEELILWAFYTGTERIVMDPSAYAKNINVDLPRILREKDMFSGMYKGAYFKWFLDSYEKVTKFELDIEYVMNKDKRELLIKSACKILADLIKNEMSDYTKELLIHDYIVNNTVYGYSEHCYDAYGALIQKEAVCQGYSRAMLLLSSLAGIYCLEAVGTDEGVNHSWNIIRLDGDYYHVDVSYNDPVGSINVLRHYYFNVTDSDLEKTRQWDRTVYPVCDSITYNYYKMNNTYLKDVSSMIKDMATGYKEGKREFEYRLIEYNPDDFTRSGMKDVILRFSNEITGVISQYSWVPYEKMKTVIITVK